MQPRRLTLLLATLLAATATAVPTHATATTTADATAFVPFVKTTFADYDDEPPEDNVADGIVTVDPNLEKARVQADLEVWTSDLRVLVTALGTKTNTGACQPTVELVATNKSDELVVRTPGETTAPADNKDPNGIDATVRDAALLTGKVLECARFRLLDAEGTVVDTAKPSVFTSWPTANINLRISGPHYRQAPVGTWLRHRLAVSADPRGYDGRLALQVPDGVQVRNVSPLTFHGVARLVVTFEVRATTRGLHPVRLRASADNARAATSALLYIWGPGGPHLPGTDSLAGRKVANFWNYCKPDGVTCQRRRSALWFLDNGLVYVGVPRHGAPTCVPAKVDPKTDRGCQRYWWDKRRGLLQVGRWIGSVHDGWIEYRGYGHSHNFGLARRGTRYHVNLVCDEWQCGDPRLRDLRLTRTGRFVLKSGTWDDVRTARGRYAIGARGRLTLRFRSGRVEVRTLGIGRGPSPTGRLAPQFHGVLLSLPGGRPPVWLAPAS